jgi:hypothetical protein
MIETATVTIVSSVKERLSPLWESDDRTGIALQRLQCVHLRTESSFM